MAPLVSIDRLSIDVVPGSGNRLRVVSDVSLSVRRGETLGIVGESGCGKTMTSLAIMGLLPRRARVVGGGITYDGRDLTTLAERELARLRGDRIAMIFQDPMTSLNPLLSIGEQLCEGYLRHGKGNAAAARERACDLLARVGIVDPARRLGQHPHELSGGLRQRVLIAMALMCEPALVVADEPTTALDVTVQAQVLQLLRELQREMNLSLVLVTHDLSVVAHVADRVAVMYAGQIVEVGPAPQVLRDPQHPYTRGLLACLPPRGRAQHGRPLGTIPGMMANPADTAPGCRFAPRCAHAAAVCRSPQGDRIHGLPGGRACRCVLAEPAAPGPSASGPTVTNA